MTRRRQLLLLLLLLVAVLGIVDLVEDFREGSPVSHVVLEGGVTAAVLVAIALEGRSLAHHLRREEAESRRLRAQLDNKEIEAARFRRDAHVLVQGLAGAIDAQLERWHLTSAEKETALLLLKGLSHREIGDARSVSEATARQQARAIYKKAGLAGRHDLAAFFLEDLLSPSS